jgi:hypothetical protein
MPIQQLIAILSWVIPILILNMNLEQQKQKHYWLDQSIFNWTKLKSIKTKNKEKETEILTFCFSKINLSLNNHEQ